MKRWLVPLLLLALLPIGLVLADLGVQIGLSCVGGVCSLPPGNSWINAQVHAVTGTTFTLGSGTGACATTSTLTGGASAGSFLCTGTAGASTQVVNLLGVTHAWACWANDDTSKVGWGAGATGTNVITLSGTIATTSDKVVFGCLAF